MALVLNGASGITLPAGAPGVPIIKGGDHDTGFHFPASGEFAISVNGVNKIHFTPTGFIFSGETTLNGLKFPTQTGGHGQYLTANASGEAVWSSPQFLATSGGTLTGAVTFASGQTFPALPYLPVTGGTLSGAVTFASGQTFIFASGQSFPALPYLPVTGGTLSGAVTFASGQTFTFASGQSFPALPYLPVTGGTLSGIVNFASGQTFSGLVTTSGGTLSGTLTFASGQTFNLPTTSNGYGTRTVSTSDPSSGSDGDIWLKVS